MENNPILERLREKQEIEAEPTETTTNEAKIEEAFRITAPTYWGLIGSMQVVHLRETDRGTKYYLVMADTNKDGVKSKLLQEWFINKDGDPRPAVKRTSIISEDMADEVGAFLFQELEF